MTAFTARLGRFFGAGLMLFLLHVVALLSVGLAVGYFHHRMGLLLEPLTRACGGNDAAARMQVAEHLLARAAALDGWQQLSWLPMAALLLAVLGALSVSVHWLRHADASLRRSAWGLLALHAAALLLAGAMLRLYDHAWEGIITALPAACMTDLAPDGHAPPPSMRRWLLQLFAKADLMPPHAPDVLAIVLCGVLMAAMVIGLWLWRTTSQLTQL
ncbi:hypothetical protein [Stenotrophomonas sp. NA06056]|uniref:hypothetical protein n=1 Tax=Stenotrophomonas sp. NA06056 TaxID=2742129 RepID=UPI00158E18BF|nr:hypothetical protein [Stenotrophomonas sp. NA06056]QKW58293.1 hypothetical protein HUT07_17385 [Stenotrophomonas sp. NA06056]